jgi:hypothetical protein
MLCSSPTASGIYVCSNCNAAQLKRIGEISPDQREAIEKGEQEYLAQFQEKPAWQPSSGYYNISGLICLTDMSPRWVWQTSHLSGLAPTHSGHRAVWTEKQAQAFVARSGKYAGLVLAVTIRDDDSLFMTRALSWG